MKNPKTIHVQSQKICGANLFTDGALCSTTRASCGPKSDRFTDMVTSLELERLTRSTTDKTRRQGESYGVYRVMRFSVKKMADTHK